MDFTVPRHFYGQVKSVIYLMHGGVLVGDMECGFVHVLWLIYPSSLLYGNLLIQKPLCEYLALEMPSDSWLHV